MSHGSSIEHRRVSATGTRPLPDRARSSSLGVGSNIGGLGVAASPPFLPMPRQPSPLHLSINVDDPSSSSTSQPPSPKLSLAPSTSSSAPTEPPHAASHPPPPPPPAPVFRAVSNPHESLVPVQPQPDSLLYRTSISQLDASATTLKKLTKAVISHAAVYTRILDELERADDELCASLGELGRWLEAGYGVQGSVWDDDLGVRNTRKGKYRAKKEEMEAMIDGPVKAVRADLKRQGLAGGGAQDRYERASKQFYQQTSSYLAQNPNEPLSPTSEPSSEAGQAARAAQFELARYDHHSALLYAVPPSSVSCLELLVKMYTWAAFDLDEVPTSSGPSLVSASGQHTPQAPATPGTPGPSRLEVNALELGSSEEGRTLKSSLASSLSRVAALRGTLLEGWSQRNEQTVTLEQQAKGKQPQLAPSPVLGPPVPISSSGVEYKKGKRMHKIHRSVGGKLRELLSSSTSSTSLAGDKSVERLARSSIDGGYGNLIAPRPRVQRDIPEETGLGVSTGSTSTPSSLPPSRPALSSRHSLQVPPRGYTSPFLPPELFPLDINTSDIRLTDSDVASPDTAGPSTPVGQAGRVMGVGGISGTGDEDETREAVGRKKEGVLWGGGVWEELGKTGPKIKWEKFWVVLDRSRIYEYRNAELERPETAHAVIDLKFASVREGRGTDRRFVFEIVTPTQGRRLYQATSEAEMKQWLYAICNAIESCINGTSSVRTFDTSKLRTASGALDDHALPLRGNRLWPGPQSRAVGLGLPVPNAPKGPGNRRSMPPMAITSDDPRRSRKTSFKNALRQSAEIAGEKWSNVINPRHSGIFDLPKASASSSRIPLRSESDIRLAPSHAAAASASVPSASPAGSNISNLSHVSHVSNARSDPSSWHEDPDGDIEKRVLEMVGLGLGLPDGASPNAARRVQSESVGKHVGKDVGVGEDMVRSKSAETVQAVPELDMRALRAVAEMPGNNRCADCGKRMKSSRWATISLRDTPMVMFLCIRCCGLHRGLGTHISKPRSVDLDIWTPESIRSAMDWGNVKGNGVWEGSKPAEVIPTDEDIAEYIKAKYVEGRWVTGENRERFRLPPIVPLSPGVWRAI